MVSSDGELEEGEIVPKHSQIWFRSDTRKEAFRTGIDLLSNEEREKMSKRKTRFGANQESEFEVRVMEPSHSDQQMQQRAERFGIEYVKDEAGLQNMKKQDLLEDHKKVDKHVKRRQEAIYLYGVDVMSTSDVMKYFEDYGPSHVEWINDSSCAIVFGDPYSTTRALVGNGEIMSLPPENYNQEDLVSHVWYKGRNFRKNDCIVSLAYRMATVEDVAEPGKRKPSRYLWKSYYPNNRKNLSYEDDKNSKRQTRYQQRQQCKKSSTLKSKNQIKKPRQAQRKRTTKLKRYVEKQQRKKQGCLDEQNQLETLNTQVVAPRRYIASVVLGLGPGTDDEYEDNKQQQSLSQTGNIDDVEAILMDMKLQPKNIGYGRQEFNQKHRDEKGVENMQIDVENMQIDVEQ